MIKKEIYGLFLLFLLGSSANASSIPFTTWENSMRSIIDTLIPIITNSLNDSNTIKADSSKVLLLNDTILSDSIQTALQPAPKKTPLEDEVIYFARDSIRFDVKEKKTYLFGKAEIKYQTMHLKAGYILIDWNDKTIYAEGIDSLGKIIDYPYFIDDEKEYKCGSIRYNFDSKKGKIHHVFTKEGEGYIHGENVKKNEVNEFFIKNGKYTTCNHDDNPHFYIKMSKLKVIPDNKIVSGPAYLVIEEVPMPIAVPFGIFPNKSDRKSGILIPAYGESQRLGFYLRNGGYYIAISDHIDMKLRGDIYSKGSWGLKTTSIYNKRYRYNGSFNINFARNKIGNKEDPSFNETRDFRIRWDHFQDPKSRPYGKFSASIDAGTKSFLENNSYNSNDYLKNALNSSVTYSWNKKKYSFTTNLRHDQNLQTRKIDFSLPEVAFNVSRFYPLRKKSRAGKMSMYEEIGLSYSLNAKNRLSTYDSTLFTTASLKNFQNGVKHTIPISLPNFKLLKYINMSPGLNYQEVWYPKSILKAWDADSQKVDQNTVNGFFQGRQFSGNISAATTIFGMYNFKSKKVIAIRHVIKPKIDFSYRPDFGNNNWGYYKTVQVDSIGNTDRYSIFDNSSYSIFGKPPDGKSGTISFSIGNNIEMKTRKMERDTVEVFKKIKLLEHLNFNMGYNLAAKEFNMSNININAATRLFNKIDLKLNSQFDPYAMDNSANRINIYEFSQNKKIARHQGTNLSVNYSFNPKMIEKLETYAAQAKTDAEVDIMRDELDYYVDFEIPWKLNLYYKLDMNKHFYSESMVLKDSLRITQSVNFNGDFSLTPKWKIEFDASYDFQEKKFGHASINIHRDLHCWEMKFRWIPFGIHKSYEFTINVKSSILQDLKWQKKQDKFEF